MNALVRVEVTTKEGVSLLVRERGMSTDVPAADLGAVTSDALQAAWGMGHDPINLVLTTTFKVAP